MGSFNLSDVSLDQAKFTGLFIGPNGTGKTCAAASGEGDVEVNDFEDRYLPLKNMYPDRKNISINTWLPADLVGAADKFDKHINALIRSCPFETVVFDSITSLTTQIVHAQMAAKGASVKKTSGGKGVAVPSWDEFNGEAQFVTDLLMECMQIKANIIFTAHPTKKTVITEGDKGKVIESITTFGVKTPDLIPGFFNEIYYFSNFTDLDGTRKRIVTVQPSIHFPNAKSALPLPDTFDISNKARLMLLIKAELAKHNLSMLKKEKEANTNYSKI